MVGSYMENPEKLQNRQNWGVGTCLGQYGIHTKKARLLTRGMFVYKKYNLLPRQHVRMPISLFYSDVAYIHVGNR